MKYTRLLKQAARLIGIIVFIYILMGIDIQSLLTTIFEIPPLPTLILFLSVIPITVLRGARWKVIAEGLDLKLNTKEATEGICLAQLANLVIPGSFGDLIRVPYMKHRGNQVDRSIISILLDAIIGSIVPFTIGILAIAIILEVNITIEAFLITGIWILGGYAFYRILRATLWTRFMQARLKRLMKEGIRGRSFFTLPSMLASIGSRRLTISMILASLLFVFYIAQAYVLDLALGMAIDWIYLTFTLGLTILMTAIPVTIQGLGIREGVLLFMFTRLYIDAVLIVSFSLILMAINLTPAIVGFVIWIKNPFVDITDQEILNAEVSDPTVINLDGV